MKSIPLAVLLCSAVVGCGVFPEKVSSDDPRIKPMLEAIAKVDRKAFGFSPFRRNDTIRLELGSHSGYDAILHLDGRTSRTMAFRSVGSSYEWIGEQEIFEGPRKYKTVDGEFRESITLTYEKVPVSGVPLNQLSIRYGGEDPALVWPRQLSLEDVRPILARWGY